LTGGSGIVRSRPARYVRDWGGGGIYSNVGDRVRGKSVVTARLESAEGHNHRGNQQRPS
jgi:hypothetical protein